MAAKKVALQLRIDEEVHTKLKEISEQELRSLNAQIEYFILMGISKYEKEHPQGSIHKA